MKPAEKRIVYGITAILSVMFFAAGSFWDAPIAQTIYRPQQPAALVFTVLGYVLFFGAFQFLTGALCRQLMHLAQTRLKRILSAVLCGYTGLSTAVLGGMGLVSDSVLGLQFPDTDFSFLHCMLIGLAVFFPPVLLGMLLNGKQADKTAVRSLLILLVLMAVTFFGHSLFTGLYCRPRYRITQLGLDGLPFLPWYAPLQNPGALTETYHLKSDALRSFFSGHALDAMLNLAVFPAFSLVLPQLRGKERLLQYIALVLAVPIILSRMVLGAHYLSDVSAGALCGLGFVLLYEKLTAEKNAG